MKHPSSRDVFAHWNERRGQHPAPSRADIEPGMIRHSLGDVFMLSVDFTGVYRFRLAGTRICALFARELKGESLLALWDEASRPQFESLIDAVTAEQTGAVAGVTGSTGEAATELELLLLPLSHQGHARIRAVGVLAPIKAPFWIGVKSLSQLTIGTIRHLNGADRSTVAPRFETVAGGRLRHGFVVHDGGKTGRWQDQAS
jgi:hypothetical protein